MSWLTRLSLLAAASTVAVWSGDAFAQSKTLPDGAEFSFPTTAPLIQADGDAELEEGDAEQQRRYFNYAHCICSAAGDTKIGVFGFDLTVTKDTSDQITGQIWVGENGQRCDDPTVRDDDTKFCQDTGKRVPDIDDLFGKELEFQIPTHQLLKVTKSECPTDRGKGKVDVWVLGPSNQSSSVIDYGKSIAYDVDTEPPPAPPITSVSAIEGQITIDWDRDVARADDIERFQLLCANADGTPVRATAKFKPEYDTSQALCGQAGADITLEAVNAGGESDVSLPAAFLTDSRYICGQAGSGDDLEIDGLENDKEYIVGVVAIDFYGNPKGVYLNKTQVPVSVIDWWEDLQGRGSEVEGGFCLIADAYGDNNPLTESLRDFRDDTLASSALGRALITTYYEHVAPLGGAVRGSGTLRVLVAIALLPAVVIALLWHALTLPGLLLLVVGLVALRRWWRRTRPFRPGAPALAGAMAAVVATIVTAAPSLGHAQSFQPYWEEEEQAALESGEEQPNWNVGIKLGPYTPAVDSQFRDQAPDDQGPEAPLQHSFRGGMWLASLEVDRFLSTRYGQIGIGGSIGFAGDSAKAFVRDSSETAGDGRGRANGDRMKFRFLPTTLTGVYRATQLDEQYGIPVVPYARAGLGYYVWWSRSPTGKISRDPDPMCEGAKCKAAGASLGLVGSVGLAIRAEGIDKSAALSMREGGVEHAGFYAELQYGWVDGFGSEKKLAVGDFTWFAGVNFEF